MLTTESEAHIDLINLQQTIQVLKKYPGFLTSFGKGCHLQANHHTGLMVLCPPTSICYECHDCLTKYHECDVRVYSTGGLRNARKYTLRCIKCSLLYNYSMYGNKHDRGFQFYTEARDLVEVSDTLYFERHLLNFQCSLA